MAYVNKTDSGWGTDCTVQCQYTLSGNQKMHAQWVQQYETMNPRPDRIEYPPFPEININIQCCINNIQDIAEATDIKQTCNQSIINYIDGYKDPASDPGCETNSDCNNGQTCSSEKKCIQQSSTKDCESDDECTVGQKCIDYKCSNSGGTPAGPEEKSKNLAIKVSIGIVLLIIFIGLCIFVYFVLKVPPNRHF
jgi:hypothetical protein